MSFGTLEAENYWLKRGRNYWKESRDAYLEVLTRRLVALMDSFSFKTVFEPGCAYGRLAARFLREWPTVFYTGLDLSRDQIAHAATFVNDSRATFQQGRIQDLQTSGKFDVVVTFSFLMHLPPDEVQSVMEKLLGLARVAVFNVEWDMRKPLESRHCFGHDYAGIYTRLGCTPFKWRVPNLGNEEEAIWQVTL